MGSLTRKMRRKQVLEEKKKAERAVKHVSKSLDGMPKICGNCCADFDNSDKEMLNQWRLAVYDNGTMHLTCPKCGPTKEEIEASHAEHK
jgi:hypothetical protein